MCLKILIVQRSEAVLKEFKQELRVLSSLPPHECIVQLKAVCVDADCPCLIEEQGDMSLGELLFGGEMHIPLTMYARTRSCALASRSRARTHERTRARARTAKLLVARKIMAGVAHLHAQNPPVLHRDLKADNVLVRRASQRAGRGSHADARRAAGVLW